MIAAQELPLSLYVHIPWCVRKCPYCDFNSHQRPAQLPEERYVDALLADLDVESAFALERPLLSIFFGGGTPSLFSAAALKRILDGVRARLALAPDCEITLETNPGTAEFDRFEGYREAGVNRLSFGVQSFDDPTLKRLGRIHGAAEVHRAWGLARGAGFDNINLDLMFALPGQTPAAALADLEQALALAPEHLSHYQLTLEPQTVFARTPPPDLPDDEAAAQMQEDCQQALARGGYRHYEVSAYAQPGRESRHNRNYWLFGDYLATGAGAHAKTTDAHGRIHRRVRQRTPTQYQALAGTPAALVEDRVVDAAEVCFEFMLNALRLREGFAAELFAARTGLQLEALPGYAKAISRGLLQADGGQVRPTELGWRFLNDTLELFLP